MISLGIYFYLTLLGMTMTLLFGESRLPLRRTLIIVYGATALMEAALFLIHYFWGLEALTQAYSLVVHLPALLLFAAISRYRGWRLVFQLLTAILLSSLIQQGAGMAYFLSGERLWALLLAYTLLPAAMLWLLLRYLRPAYLQTVHQLKHGWWLPCLVIAGYYVIIFSIIPGFVGQTAFSTVVKPAISLLMVGFYAVLLFFFSSVQRENDIQRSAELAALRLSALQSRMDAVSAAEEAIRVERHDLRHRLQTVAELVARGNQQQALTFLSAAQQRLDERQPVRWCRPPILDAVFSSYCAQAQREGVRVDARIDLSSQLSVDEGELAIVLANALENAVNACKVLPQEKREIRCKVICYPGLMLEVSNPCAQEVRFDEKGIPVSGREGHGIGVQSISAFCRKYGAVSEFQLKNGWFHMQVIL